MLHMLLLVNTISLALCETNLHDDIQDSDFQLPGYLPSHRKDAGHLQDLGVYVKSNLPIARETSLEDVNNFPSFILILTLVLLLRILLSMMPLGGLTATYLTESFS